MADYTEIKGNRIQYLDSDPTLTSATEGQVWYNTATGTLKGLVQLQAWSSGSPLITGTQQHGAFGTQSAALSFGGIISGPANTTNTEEYNGSGWTSGGAMNTARGNLLSSWGVQTAGIVATGSNTGGTNLSNVEEYNGTSWSNKNTISTARRQAASIGQVTTAGAVAGGYSTTNTNATEEFDGTNWTAGGNLNTGRRGFTGSGTLTAGVVYGGYTTTESATTEEYNGTAWTSGNNINLARNNLAGSSNGPQTSSIAFGGSTPSPVATPATETYDGTSWTTSPATLGTGQNSSAGAGNGTSALSIGGSQPSPSTNLTEEYNQSINVFTAGAWASGTNLPTAHNNGGGNANSSNDALQFGGGTPGGYQGQTVSYDGSTWTTSPSTLPSLSEQFGCAGVPTDALAFSGGGPSAPLQYMQGTTVEYNGSTWSTTNNVNTLAGSPGGAGSATTAGLKFGGNVTPQVPPTSAGNITEEYDGTSWTSVNNMNTGRKDLGGSSAGTQTAALAISGRNAAATVLNTTEEYDGTSWTGVNGLITGRYKGGKSGTTSATLYFGGSVPPSSTATESFDGTTWATAPSIASARDSAGSGGTSTSGIFMGGNSPGGNSAVVEEFTGETSAVTASTLTTS